MWASMHIDLRSASVVKINHILDYYKRNDGIRGFTLLWCIIFLSKGDNALFLLTQKFQGFKIELRIFLKGLQKNKEYVIIWNIGSDKMTLKFVEDYLQSKILNNENYIVCTFYDLRIRNNLDEEEVNEFLRLGRNKLENNGYSVFFNGEKFIYQNTNRIVQDNELLIAIKNYTLF